MSGVFRTRPGPIRLPVCEKELNKCLSSKGNYLQLKAYANVIPGGAQVLVQQEAELSSLVHLVLDLKSNIQEKGYGIFLCG